MAKEPPKVKVTFMSKPSFVIARSILDGFHRHFGHFQQITACAQSLFESAQWAEIHRQSLIRLDYYKSDVLETIQHLQQLETPFQSIELWPEFRREFQHLVENLVNRELAETFFNSVYCSIFDHQQISNAAMFVNASLACAAPREDDAPIFHDIIFSYKLGNNLAALMESILDQPGFAIPYENKQQDVQNIVTSLTETILPTIGFSGTVTNRRHTNAAFTKAPMELN